MSGIAAPKKGKKIRKILSLTIPILLLIGGILYYFADRYLIKHVVISNVSAYESQVLATASYALDSDSSETVSSETEDQAVFDDFHYSDDSMTVKITEVTTGDGDDTVTYFVADVTLTNTTSLRTGFADNAFGTNIIENTSAIAEDNNAIFAINGDYYGFRDDGIEIRNGVVYRDDGARTGLAIYTDGTMKIYDEQDTTAEELLADGVWNTLSFGPALIENGEIPDDIDTIEIDTNFGNHSIQGNQPRTGIGIISANHFLFIVVDGRSEGYSKGVTLPEFAEIFASYGCTDAYNLDGGGSSTMYFMGRVVNNPLGKDEERGVSDILYLS